MRCDALGHTNDVLKVGSQILVQWSGDRNHNGIRLRDLIETRYRTDEPLIDHCLQFCIVHITDEVLAPVYGICSLWILLNADDLKAHLRFLHCKRQSNVTKANHGNHGRLVLKLLNKVLLHHKKSRSDGQKRRERCRWESSRSHKSAGHSPAMQHPQRVKDTRDDDGSHAFRHSCSIQQRGVRFACTGA